MPSWCYLLTGIIWTVSNESKNVLQACLVIALQAVIKNGEVKCIEKGLDTNQYWEIRYTDFPP